MVRHPHPKCVEQSSQPACVMACSAFKVLGVPCQGCAYLEPMRWQVTREELLDEDDYEDLLDDIACEVEAKFGALASWAPQVRPRACCSRGRLLPLTRHWLPC